MRFDSAQLFGSLFNEWLASGDSVAGPEEAGSDSASASSSNQTSSSYVEVGRKEMHDQKAKLISIIFEDHPIDVPRLNAYLEGLFKPEEAAKALERLRKDLKEFGHHLQRKCYGTIHII
ncbi:hypothetical protein BDZ97DRAFT_1775896 [Flammula alnicola]|nr:hypothetical protein BDZ97DRAFT_1775896 [Flammula alnicola]